VEPLVVEATRADVVEARHRVHAVAVRDGRVVASAGDPHLVTYLRSSAKPIQVLPVVRARPDLDDEEIAIACASHLARPEQLAVVRRLLAKAPAAVSELETGPAPTPIEHNCSGKHAAMLALCRARGWPSAGYRHADHPCQRELRLEVAGLAEVAAARMPSGVDGCGVPTFALPLDRAAHAFARLPHAEGGARVARAMRANPDLLRGPAAADALLIRRLDSWIAKGGAEGLFCAASADRLGVALKVEDGSFRAILPALAAFLRRVGLETGDLGVVAVENSSGESVGELRCDP
jgi:L-asparaginase II